MCETCREQAEAHWGEPFPDPRELLDAIKTRAEVALDCEMLERAGSHMTEEGAGLVRAAIHETLVSMAGEMGERGLVWAPAWVTYLGQETVRALEEESRG